MMRAPNRERPGPPALDACREAPASAGGQPQRSPPRSASVGDIRAARPAG